MSDQRLTRRTFITHTRDAGLAVVGTIGLAGVAGGGSGGRGTLLAATQRRGIGPNDRISIGCIGVGDRGFGALMQEIKGEAAKHNVEITAVCDVWKPNLERAAAKAKEWFGKEPRQFTRFGELLALKEVDAVTIATPDFAHTPIMIEALTAGKDVYVEKPMSIELAGANQALDLARKNERVVQVGTQRRSDGRFKAAAKEWASGGLGMLNRISAAMYVNQPRWARAFDDCKPADVDWDAYLLNQPKRPFDARLLRRWQMYRLGTNGLAGLWMVHYSDSVNMITGSTYPACAVAHGGRYVWEDGREHDDTFHAILEYPLGKGFLMDWAMGLGNSTGVHFTLHGAEGTMDLEAWTVSSAGGKAGRKAETRKMKAEAGESHMGNWLECLRTRKRPNADIEYGHQHSVATILAALARETGRRQVYDPIKREITGV
ncbi:MAG: Gfo/Idh/MocA family oxidoreductase [Phycisphaerae bacterium]|nr:Gfo/Idh/MocA family oxidoreductase [Phycisphaerae bacterium]